MSYFQTIATKNNQETNLKSGFGLFVRLMLPELELSLNRAVNFH